MNAFFLKVGRLPTFIKRAVDIIDMYILTKRRFRIAGAYPSPGEHIPSKGEIRMKKVTSEPSSLPASAENAERGITRRAFLKGTAGFVLLCGSGFGLYGLNEAAKASEEENVGAEIAYGGRPALPSTKRDWSS